MSVSHLSPPWFSGLVAAANVAFRLLAGLPQESILEEKWFRMDPEGQPLKEINVEGSGNGTFEDAAQNCSEHKHRPGGSLPFCGRALLLITSVILVWRLGHTHVQVTTASSQPRTTSKGATPPHWVQNSTCASDGLAMSCSSICKVASNGLCSAPHLQSLHDEYSVSMAAASLGRTCDDFHDHHAIQGSWDGPWVLGTLCGYSSSSHWQASCNARPHCGYERFCPCASDVKGGSVTTAESVPESSNDMGPETIVLAQQKASPPVAAHPVMQPSNWTVSNHCGSDGRGLSCDEVCSTLGAATAGTRSLRKDQETMRCDAEALLVLAEEEDVAKAAAAVGLSCTEFHDHHAIRGTWDGPWILGTLCGYSSSQKWVPDCTSRSHCGYKRLCPCAGK